MFFIKKLIEWLLPHACILCKNITQNAYDICLPCLEHLPFLGNACFACANKLSKTHQNALCASCLKQKPPFDMTHGLFRYEPPIPKLIRDLKFNHALTHAKLLGELLTQKILSEWYHEIPFPTAIIPIPLHNDRIKERGFNQALEIARPIAKALKLPLLVQDAIRIKPTLPQATLKAEERKKTY